MKHEIMLTSVDHGIKRISALITSFQDKRC